MFLEIIFSLVATSFFAIFALRPTFLTISSLLKEIATKEEMIVKMDTKIGNLQTAQDILSQESLRIPILKLSVPTLPQPQIFAHQIEAIASMSQVTVLGVSVDETPLKGNLLSSDQKTKDIPDFPADTGSMGFSISATGSFQNLFSFLKEIEELRSPVKIDILAMSLSKKEEGDILTMVVTGKVPYLRGVKE